MSVSKDDVDGEGGEADVDADIKTQLSRH